MSPNVDLDLDVLLPESKKIKVNGMIIDANPIRVSDLVKIESIKDTNDLSKLIDVVSGFVPQIKEANPTLEQLNRLIVFLSGGQEDKKKAPEAQ
jgi:hypothetical protein